MSSPERGTPEGALIRVARKARGINVKEAARRVPIRLGESRWYHIEAGTEGKEALVVAPPETLAHMAHVVGVMPEQLAEVGRGDAAEILREILRQEVSATYAATVDAIRGERKYAESWKQAIWEISALTEHERRLAINAIQLWRRDLDGDDLDVSDAQQRATGK